MNKVNDLSKSNPLVVRTLKKFGLNEKEIKVYVVAIKNDGLNPTEISKLTGIPRSSIYDVLMNLSLKGLVELEQSDGITKYQTLVRAKNPSLLRKITREKQKDLVKLEVDIVEILPWLRGIFHDKKNDVDFQFFPGIDGLIQIYNDKELYAVDLDQYAWDNLVPTDVFGQKVLNKIVTSDNRVRRHRKSIDRELVCLNDWAKHVISYQWNRDPEYLIKTEIRYIDNPVFDMRLRISIKDRYVRIASADENEVWGMKICSDALATSLKSIFLLNWALAKPVTERMVRLWGKNKYLEVQNKRIFG
ncbi:helix-turn-helix domain-containing protein [Candidatus Dojkabacteria bacterium]|nr:helix-turn-helix domain-containing protein [Candidatus Dojkabacteria bacterium]